MVKLILELGADANLKSVFGMSPLVLAIEQGNLRKRIREENVMERLHWR